MSYRGWTALPRPGGKDKDTDTDIETGPITGQLPVVLDAGVVMLLLTAALPWQRR